MESGLAIGIGHGMAWKGSGWVSDPLRSMERMFDASEDREREARRVRAHALLDAVLAYSRFNY